MKKTIQIIAGILIVLTAIWGYRNSTDHMYELTFISTTTCGIVLLSDGLIELSMNKKVSA